MLKKYIKILLIFLTVVVLLQVALPAIALEVDYPTVRLGGINYNITSGVTLLKYIQYFFVFIVTTAGIFGVVSIVLNSLRILLAFGSPESISKARTDIFGSVLGIFLLLISVILLTTINRQLIANTTTNGYPPGIYYVGVFDPADPTTWEYEEAKTFERNVDSWYPDIYDWYLWYNCDPARTESKNLLVWLYSLPNYIIMRGNNPANNINTIEMTCTLRSTLTNADLGNRNITINLSPGSGIKSLKWVEKKPGIYFYLKPNCEGISTEAQRINGRIQAFDNTGETQTPLSFKIVNGSNTEPTEQYGVVLAKGSDTVAGDIGQCTSPTTNTACQNIDYSNLELGIIPITNPVDRTYDPASGVFRAVTAYVLKVAPFGITNPMITFQSKYYRQIETYNSSYQGDVSVFYPGPDWNSTSNLNTFIKENGEIFGLNLFTTQRTISDDCNTSTSCLDKISFYKNAYYVILYSKSYLNQDNAYCKVFSQSVDSLEEEPVLKEGRALYKMYIVPSGDPAGDQQP